MKKILFSIPAITLVITSVMVGSTTMANAQIGVNDWAGSYRGFIDGRKATMNINFSSITGCQDTLTGARPRSPGVYSVEVRDLDRGKRYRRDCIYVYGDDGPFREPISERWRHVWDNLNLRDLDTGQVVDIGTYILHTWNTGVITGVKKWNDRNYGVIFIKSDMTIPTCTSGEVVSGTCRF